MNSWAGLSLLGLAPFGFPQLIELVQLGLQDFSYGVFGIMIRVEIQTQRIGQESAREVADKMARNIQHLVHVFYL